MQWWQTALIVVGALIALFVLFVIFAGDSGPAVSERSKALFGEVLLADPFNTLKTLTENPGWQELETNNFLESKSGSQNSYSKRIANMNSFYALLEHYSGLEESEFAAELLTIETTVTKETKVPSAKLIKALELFVKIPMLPKTKADLANLALAELTAGQTTSPATQQVIYEALAFATISAAGLTASGLTNGAVPPGLTRRGLNLLGAEKVLSKGFAWLDRKRKESAQNSAWNGFLYAAGNLAITIGETSEQEFLDSVCNYPILRVEEAVEKLQVTRNSLSSSHADSYSHALIRQYDTTSLIENSIKLEKAFEARLDSLMESDYFALYLGAAFMKHEWAAPKESQAQLGLVNLKQAVMNYQRKSLA